MPLRDHFRPPLTPRRSWEGFHAHWPSALVNDLNGRLPPQYLAEPRVHHGAPVEIDVATFEDEGVVPWEPQPNDGGVATAVAVWSPAAPTLTVDTNWPEFDEYEIQVNDITDEIPRLVAAVEIVSPANKDRPETRRAFVAKCAALLQAGVSVVIVDVVTIRHFNLYHELLEWTGHPPTAGEDRALYATACRTRKGRRQSKLETWEHALEIGQPLPTVPLWLTEDFAVPLDLETTYETTCRALRIA